jgi:hypothetical protein
MPQFLLFMQLFQELFPLVHSAVQVVQQSAPQAATGAQKFDAALTSVSAVIAKAPAAATEFVTAKTALAGGDAAAATASIGHMIELSLSICKSFGIFSKAGVVQNAAPLTPEPPASA